MEHMVRKGENRPVYCNTYTIRMLGMTGPVPPTPTGVVRGMPALTLVPARCSATKTITTPRNGLALDSP